MASVPVSVIIPTWHRSALLLTTLEHLAACDPRPAEVVIHIDGNDDETAPALAHPPLPVRIIQSDTTVGPGGGRNRLMREATQEIVVSLDDDSYPVTTDFFRDVKLLADAHAQFAVFALPAPARGAPPPEPARPLREAAAFEGCAVVLRRSAVLSVAGYLPLRYAYGMEECDMVLQLLDAGFSLARVDRPYVRHDIKPQHHTAPAVDRAWLVNTALLPFLRFPWPYILLLPLRFLRRMLYSIRFGRVRPVLAALTATPRTLWQYRHLRAPVKRKTFRRYLTLRRR